MHVTEQAELARSLVGKTVVFRHDPNMDPIKVLRATPDGLIELEGWVGQFAPAIFMTAPSKSTT